MLSIKPGSDKNQYRGIRLTLLMGLFGLCMCLMGLYYVVYRMLICSTYYEEFYCFDITP